jgi:DNA-binding transcriptional MerR regulator
MKIGELARRTGLNASAIRYYEKQGILAPPTARAGNAYTPAMPCTACF